MTAGELLRVGVTDDDDIVRESVRDIIDAAADMRCVATCCSGLEAVEAAARIEMDVMLLDLKMDVMDGVQATRLIHEHRPDLRLVVWTAFEHDSAVTQAIEYGATGFLLKNCGPQALLDSLRAASWGMTVLSPAVQGTINKRVSGAGPAARQDLNEQDRKILTLVAQGRTNTDIAALLYVSEGTVKNHVASLFHRLGASTRVQLAVIAVRRALI